MHVKNMLNLILATILLCALAIPAVAGPPAGKGKNKEDDGTSSGGNGFNTPFPISLSLQFETGCWSDNAVEVTDAIAGDCQGAYVDEPRQADSEYRMDVHIDGDSGGSFGNMFLLIGESSRRVYLDIATGCVDGCDNQPFSAREFATLGLTVSANESIAGGFCGMDVNGPPITAPMQIVYKETDTTVFGTTNPGFIDFFPVTKRRSPCFGQTSEVTVTRTGPDTWSVSGDRAACVTWPGGREFGGLSVMPFGFEVRIADNADRSCP